MNRRAAKHPIQRRKCVKRPRKPTEKVLFWNHWDTLGGPGLNGWIEVILRGDAYFTVSTNNALDPPETTYGPFSSFEEALACPDAGALFVGPGTYEVGSAKLNTPTLLRRLQVYLPDESEDDEWEVKVNGAEVKVSKAGFALKKVRSPRG